MAIYHFSVVMVSRSKGQSAVAAAASLSGTKLFDARLGLVANSARKKGVLYSEIMAPKHAPDWMRDRERLWNGAEAAGRRKDAQVARDVRMALPNELSLCEQRAVMRTFIASQFIAAGMVADFAIHAADVANPYGRVMLTVRHIDQDAFGQKNRDWNSIAFLMRWRAAWAEVCNAALEKAGHDARIDHRSYAAQGVDLESPPKRPKRLKRNDVEGQAYVDEQMAKYNAVVRRNGEAIRRDPTIAIRAMRLRRKTFTEKQMAAFLRSHTVDDAQCEACLTEVMAAVAESEDKLF